jgi:nitrate reductase assembly molybdenum cofactor insertion protein NarJ
VLKDILEKTGQLNEETRKKLSETRKRLEDIRKRLDKDSQDYLRLVEEMEKIVREERDDKASPTTRDRSGS